MTNPTHCAVALRYVPGEDAAPIVVAKGVDHLAAKIREIAGEHGVPCVEDRPLAWTLYRTVKLGREVPAHLFRAVAEIMAYVFRLGGWERIDRVRSSLRPKGSGDLMAMPSRDPAMNTTPCGRSIASPKSRWWRAWSANRDLLIPLVMFGVLLVMVIPVPPFLLDSSWRCRSPRRS